MRNVFRSLSNACPIMMVCELIIASRDLRIAARGRTAVARFSAVMPEKRVLKSLWDIVRN